MTNRESQAPQSHPIPNKAECKDIGLLNTFSKWLGIFIAISLCIGGVAGMMNSELCTYPRSGARLCAYGIQAQVKGAMTLAFGLLIGAGLLLKANRFKIVAIWMCGLVITGTFIASLSV